MPRNTTPYSEKEKKLLIEIFEHSSKKYILEQFPTRGPQSLFKLAKKLGLKRSQELINKDIFKNGCPKKDNSWAENEIDVLKEIYTNNLRSSIESKLPGRTWKGIVIMARKLDLHRNPVLCHKDGDFKRIENGNLFSPKEDQIIQEIYPHSSKKIILETIHKPWSTIHRKALKLGLHRDIDLINEDRKIRYKPRKDSCSEEEKQILLQFFKHNTKKFILEKFSKFNRSWQSIRRFADQLGLKQLGDKWIPEEDKILIEFYGTEPRKNTLARLPGRSLVSITKRAKKLGLQETSYWTTKEDDILIKYYPNTLQEVLLPMLPGRTWKAITWHAINVLKLTRTKEIIQEEAKKTSRLHFGADYHTQTQEGRDKIKATVQEKFGVDNVFQAEEIKKKIIETNLKKFGVENPNQSPEIREKSRQTNQEKYGVDNPFQIMDKVQAGMLKKHSLEYPLQNPEIKAKQQTTNTER